MNIILKEINRLLSKKGRIIVAIEGGSATGKSTLADALAREYDANVFHMDDFFLQPHQRTKERFQTPGGNVDWERFLEEVLIPASQGRDVTFRPFDCSTMSLGEAVTVSAKPVTIVEGVYSMHPALEKYMHFSLFLYADEEVRHARILRRNGERMLRRFVEEWIPMEDFYFEETLADERCTLRYKGD